MADAGQKNDFRLRTITRVLDKLRFRPTERPRSPYRNYDDLSCRKEPNYSFLEYDNAERTSSTANPGSSRQRLRRGHGLRFLKNLSSIHQASRTSSPSDSYSGFRTIEPPLQQKTSRATITPVYITPSSSNANLDRLDRDESLSAINNRYDRFDTGYLCTHRRRLSLPLLSAVQVLSNDNTEGFSDKPILTTRHYSLPRDFNETTNNSMVYPYYKDGFTECQISVCDSSVHKNAHQFQESMEKEQQRVWNTEFSQNNVGAVSRDTSLSTPSCPDYQTHYSSYCFPQSKNLNPASSDTRAHGCSPPKEFSPALSAQCISTPLPAPSIHSQDLLEPSRRILIDELSSSSSNNADNVLHSLSSPEHDSQKKKKMSPRINQRLSLLMPRQKLTKLRAQPFENTISSLSPKNTTQRPFAQPSDKYPFQVQSTEKKSISRRSNSPSITGVPLNHYRLEAATDLVYKNNENSYPVLANSRPCCHASSLSSKPQYSRSRKSSEACALEKKKRNPLICQLGRGSLSSKVFVIRTPTNLHSNIHGKEFAQTRIEDIYRFIEEWGMRHHYMVGQSQVYSEQAYNSALNYEDKYDTSLKSRRQQQHRDSCCDAFLSSRCFWTRCLVWDLSITRLGVSARIPEFEEQVLAFRLLDIGTPTIHFVSQLCSSLLYWLCFDPFGGNFAFLCFRESEPLFLSLLGCVMLALDSYGAAPTLSPFPSVEDIVNELQLSSVTTMIPNSQTVFGHELETQNTLHVLQQEHRKTVVASIAPRSSITSVESDMFDGGVIGWKPLTEWNPGAIHLLKRFTTFLSHKKYNLGARATPYRLKTVILNNFLSPSDGITVELYELFDLQIVNGETKRYKGRALFYKGQKIRRETFLSDHSEDNRYHYDLEEDARSNSSDENVSVFETSAVSHKPFKVTTLSQLTRSAAKLLKRSTRSKHTFSDTEHRGCHLLGPYGLSSSVPQDTCMQLRLLADRSDYTVAGNVVNDNGCTNLVLDFAGTSDGTEQSIARKPIVLCGDVLIVIRQLGASHIRKCKDCCSYTLSTTSSPFLIPQQQSSAGFWRHSNDDASTKLQSTIYRDKGVFVSYSFHTAFLSNTDEKEESCLIRIKKTDLDIPRQMEPFISNDLELFLIAEPYDLSSSLAMSIINNHESEENVESLKCGVSQQQQQQQSELKKTTSTKTSRRKPTTKLFNWPKSSFLPSSNKDNNDLRDTKQSIQGELTLPQKFITSPSKNSLTVFDEQSREGSRTSEHSTPSRNEDNIIMTDTNPLSWDQKDQIYNKNTTYCNNEDDDDDDDDNDLHEKSNVLDYSKQRHPMHHQSAFDTSLKPFSNRESIATSLKESQLSVIVNSSKYNHSHVVSEQIQLWRWKHISALKPKPNIEPFLGHHIVIPSQESLQQLIDEGYEYLHSCVALKITKNDHWGALQVLVQYFLENEENEPMGLGQLTVPFASLRRDFFRIDVNKAREYAENPHNSRQTNALPSQRVTWGNNYYDDDDNIFPFQRETKAHNANFFKYGSVVVPRLDVDSVHQFSNNVDFPFYPAEELVSTGTTSLSSTTFDTSKGRRTLYQKFLEEGNICCYKKNDSLLTESIENDDGYSKSSMSMELDIDAERHEANIRRRFLPFPHEMHNSYREGPMTERTNRRLQMTRALPIQIVSSSPNLLDLKDTPTTPVDNNVQIVTSECPPVSDVLLKNVQSKSFAIHQLKSCNRLPGHAPFLAPESQFTLDHFKLYQDGAKRPMFRLPGYPPNVAPESQLVYQLKKPDVTTAFDDLHTTNQAVESIKDSHLVPYKLPGIPPNKSPPPHVERKNSKLLKPNVSSPLPLKKEISLPPSKSLIPQPAQQTFEKKLPELKNLKHTAPLGRKIFWKPLRDGNIDGTIFAEISGNNTSAPTTEATDQAKMDVSALVDSDFLSRLFVKQTPKKNVETSRLKHNEGKCLLDSKRAQNLSIVLVRLKHVPHEIRKFLFTLDSGAFTVDEINKIQSLILSPEEDKLFEDYFSSGGTEALLRKFPEQKILPLRPSKCYRLLESIAILRFQKTYEPIINGLHKEIEILKTAVQQIKSSTKFKQVLSVVLRWGNYINHGIAGGDLYIRGFTLGSLLRLTEFKTTVDPSITSLHFLAANMLHAVPNLHLELLHKDMPAVALAAKCSGDAITMNLDQLARGLHTLRQEKKKKIDETLTSSVEDLDAYQIRCSHLESTELKAATAVENIHMQAEEIWKEIYNTGRFFGDESAHQTSSYKRNFKIEGFFITLQEFLMKFQNCCEDVQRRPKKYDILLAEAVASGNENKSPQSRKASNGNSNFRKSGKSGSFNELTWSNIRPSKKLYPHEKQKENCSSKSRTNYFMEDTFIKDHSSYQRRHCSSTRGTAVEKISQNVTSPNDKNIVMESHPLLSQLQQDLVSPEIRRPYCGSRRVIPSPYLHLNNRKKFASSPSNPVTTNNISQTSPSSDSAHRLYGLRYPQVSSSVTAIRKEVNDNNNCEDQK